MEQVNNDIKEFFNIKASNWDNESKADDNLLKAIFEITGIKNNMKVLDIGCGTGVLFGSLLKYAPSEIVGVDISDKMLEIARKKYGHFDNIKFKNMDVLELDENDFDIVYIYNAYPHIMDVEKLKSKLKQICKSGARIVIVHGMSRNFIENIHKNVGNNISRTLRNVKTETKFWEDVLDIDIAIDTDKFYMLSGILKH
ncbi:ribosomal protein L11 methyltransferase-like protein [Peptoanaerobacter stomatis]|uniref:Ribosomal protein L11 methyltransferase-like protein n=1 Tax=Peptoanaerobacter stomatis TaxID=796937 RepID=J5URE4_9FIRM|nr:class I SAM-dependent methyltransferase [Peptoanaerobacter stomatis]EJU24544.1 ribosomal protein L11 methyltransferase-like protein [Peptoanaerobacter stomatis]